MSEQPQATTGLEFSKMVADIQSKMKVPKTHTVTMARNSYPYRTLEDITQEFHRHKSGLVLSFSEDYVTIRSGPVNAPIDDTYLRSTARLTYDGHVHETSSLAQIDFKSAMSPPQRTGTAISYVRKYAAAGLFAIEGGLPDADEIAEAEGQPKVDKPQDSPQQTSSYSNAPQGQPAKSAQPKDAAPRVQSKPAANPSVQSAKPVKQSGVVQPEPPPNLGGDRLDLSPDKSQQAWDDYSEARQK